MENTRIELPDDLHRQLQRVAYEQGKPVGQIVREALAQYVVERRSTVVVHELPTPAASEEAEPLTAEEPAELEQNPLYQIIGLVKSNEVEPPMSDAAVNHDYYIYLDGKG